MDSLAVCDLGFQVDDIMYPITEEALDTVLSAYGEVVQKAVYERPGIWQVND